MSNPSRRKMITTGLAATAGVSGLAVAAKLADQYGLTPPDGGGIYGPGTTLTYAAHRLLTANSLAREFPRGQISNPPYANGRPPKDDAFKRLQEGGFKDWKLEIDGMVARPGALSLAELKSYPASSQITHLACEEGWSFIAEWTGVPLHQILDRVGILPQAKYVVFHTIQPRWWGSVDMADALHPQTLITYGMNGGELPPGHGGPMRLRVPRQLGYKSLKFITRMTVTDSVKGFSKGLGASSAEGGYSWYAGI